ncbi:hypothetical protein ARZXY2_4726 (plasmid) [Arthrobacter sp. ZXY-2]|nr:hypothetical protein ARZXY2_4726 [Arthrobacter sp. ZXY-2]
MFSSSGIRIPLPKAQRSDPETGDPQASVAHKPARVRERHAIYTRVNV